jgi:hypothetical protein
MFEDLLGTIKIWSKILVAIVFEGGMIVRMKMEEYLIPFFKIELGVMMIILLLHHILIHDHIIFESVENVSLNCEFFFDLLYLKDSH